MISSENGIFKFSITFDTSVLTIEIIDSVYPELPPEIEVENVTQNVLDKLDAFIKENEGEDNILYEICEIFKRGVDGDLSGDEKEESKEEPKLIKKASIIRQSSLQRANSIKAEQVLKRPKVDWKTLSQKELSVELLRYSGLKSILGFSGVLQFYGGRK